VGALFAVTKNKLVHFCTAAVVPSRPGNLAITAAHCLDGRHIGLHGNVLFAPGYHNGQFPHGLWVVMSAITDSNWQRTKSPNDDVAFLVVGRPGHHIQNYTGAESVSTNVKLPEVVQVIGYPDSSSSPITCTAPARSVTFARKYQQLVFDCGGYTNGTSGGPFLMKVSKKTHEGDVIGVIGGYELGGDLASVSYSSRFLRNVASLYKQAERA
jgi:V8-like Glu-specific endopeptidase